MIVSKLIIGAIIYFIVYLYVKSKNILKDDTKSSKHKKLASSKSSYLTGGLIFLFLFCIFVQDYYLLKFFCICVFLIGFLSDLKIINNPHLRLILQITVLTIFALVYKVNINVTDLYYLDLFLKNNFISYFFTIFCFLILINGTNFFDGLNTLVIGYYILSLLGLLFLINSENINYDNSLILNILIILTINYIFNFSGRNFLGDSGAYIIAFVVGYVIVDFYSFYDDFSVLFVVILLWYPAFENLFSIVRKKISKENPYKPDNKHLHQLIFLIVENSIKNKKLSNTLTATMINIYNSIIILIGYIYSSSSIKLLVLIFFTISIYLILYRFLQKKLFKELS